MPGESRNIFRVACIYTTSVIGAGFASGHEIMQFFTVYDAGGFFGIILAGILFSAAGSIMLGKVYSDRIKNYEEFIFPVFGWRLGWVVEIVITVFMLCIFCIMLAGSGRVVSDRLGIHFRYASLLMAIICTVLILANIRGLAVLSSIVTPVLILGILLAGVYIVFFRDTAASVVSGYLDRMTRNWLVSSILYVSYNCIPAFIILCSLLPCLKTRRTAVWGGILGGAFLSLATLVINIAIRLFMPGIMVKELPFLEILERYSSLAGDIYSVVLWAAMLVSAVTSGLCFVGRVEAMLKVDRRIIIFTLCAVSIPLSAVGFSKLVSTVYPIFGYLGLFMIITVLIHGMLKLRG
ncbi:MAG: hypothetical protein ACOX4M_04305 [Acetivibrionales bacterium]